MVSGMIKLMLNVLLVTLNVQLVRLLLITVLNVTEEEVDYLLVLIVNLECLLLIQ